MTSIVISRRSTRCMIDIAEAYAAVWEHKVALPDNLIDFASDYLVIQDKADELIPFQPNAAQRDFYTTLKYSGRQFHLLIKARQLGFSTLIQAWATHEAWRKPTRIATMAHDSDTTAKLRRVGSLFYEKLPDTLGIRRDMDNAATTIYAPHRSEITIATAGGKAKGRGGTYNFFHGSEVAFWNDPTQTIAGVLQGLTKEGLCIFETTANGAQGWVWETVNNPGKWMIHFYPWYWEAEYRLPVSEPLTYTDDELALIDKAAEQGFTLTPEHIVWRRDKQDELGFLFPQEYPEDLYTAFITSGNSVFGDVSHALHAPMQPEYDETHRYVAGVDWGQEADYTTCSIMDSTTNIEVELLRMNRLNWFTMRERIVDACVRWNCEAIQPEKNSMGSTNIEELAAQFYEAEHDITIRPITMTNKKKQQLVSNFYRGIHQDGVQLQDHDFATSELRNFIQNQTSTGLYQFEAASGAHDDTVMARMLSYDAACKVLTE